MHGLKVVIAIYKNVHFLDGKWGKQLDMGIHLEWSYKNLDIYLWMVSDMDRYVHYISSMSFLVGYLQNPKGQCMAGSCAASGPIIWVRACSGVSSLCAKSKDMEFCQVYYIFFLHTTNRWRVSHPNIAPIKSIVWIIFFFSIWSNKSKWAFI